MKGKVKLTPCLTNPCDMEKSFGVLGKAMDPKDFSFGSQVSL
jgi:hypothetical protein